MDQEKIGLIIKNIREENNITQKELADKLGVTYQAVSKWERGLNIPDIQLLKQICDIYNVDFESLVNGKKIDKDANKISNKIKIILFIMFISILSIIIIILLVININHDDFEFKTLSSDSCSFSVSGSVAYNKDKTTVYISNINYCGEEENNVYLSYDCILYQTVNDVQTKIGEYKQEEKSSLKDFVDNVSINVSSKTTCSKNSSFTLVINAKENATKSVLYEIPITLNDDCK